jgi:hypothetical protein
LIVSAYNDCDRQNAAVVRAQSVRVMRVGFFNCGEAEAVGLRSYN